MEGGLSCFAGRNIEIDPSTLEYAFVSDELDKMTCLVGTLSTTLATRMPLSMAFEVSGAKTSKVLALDRKSKPNAKRVIGGMLVLELQWGIWKAQCEAFCRELTWTTRTDMWVSS